MRKRYVPTATMVEVSNSIFVRPPTDAASSRFGHRQSRLVLGHLSNLSVAKGLDVVVDAAVNLVESGADVALRLAGPLDSEVEERIVQRAASKLGARLSYWGRISQEQLDEFFAGVDLFVFPSRYVNEALPLVVLEAVSRGIPCVASDVGCLGEMLGTVAIPDPGPSDVVSFVRRGERRVVDRDALAHDRDTAVDALASVLPIDRSRLPGTHG